MQRTDHLEQAENQEFDICIIGGGATGAGCLLDAQSRGLKAILVEKHDFASETSSKSTKLIHGGVRYLEQAVKQADLNQYHMVKKALRERLTLIHNAPHLAHPLALLTPCMSWMEGIYYTAGLKMYDTLSGDLSIGKSEWLNKEEALKRNPSLTHKIHSAVLYYDGQLNDARYNMSLVKTAMQYGAVALNHAEARAFEKDASGRLAVLHIRDSLTGRLLRIRARRFINATGPFSDRIRLLANPTMGRRMRVSKGVHIIVPGELMPSDTAILVPKTDDGRVVFIIPYNGKLMIGTTETESELGETEPVVERAEVDYLISYVNRYFEKPITADQVIAGFAGLRPLLQADPNADTKQLVRDHEVEVDPTSGLVSILGGKWTTYRLMSKDTIDKFYELEGLPEKPCITDHIKLVGAEGYADDFWKVLVSKFGIPEDIARHLNRQYGTESLEIAQLMHDHPDWKERLSEQLPNTKAEVVFVVRAEMAQTLKDVLARRFGLELTDWQSSDQISETVADLMAAELNWTDDERRKAVYDYHAEIDWFRKSAGLIV
ncbi:glycerol-3-phosphate dehydrogenase/oxidase [Larkinella terrae]|uniref:FAD-dependent oxidoreductase n=1 Tax=Larkinella terrae TaxID=2025311 RepID=A0A7K0ESY0_9BACT|nr:FAD-dependent oxidoreductase [Larkinella terrae]MRS64518.1 FAD-dependent oxidoreductase [Larkinella terrae]